jgi:hypothetical protein
MLGGQQGLGDVRVQIGSNRVGAIAALTMAAALGGCANIDLGESGGWFQKKLDVFGRNGGYTYSELSEAPVRRRRRRQRRRRLLPRRAARV